ncbi:MAG: S41 family peptidase [Cyanobacteria bacterium P01_D01_bin.116]
MEIKLITKKTVAIALMALTITTILFPENIAVAQKPSQKVSLFKESPKEIVDEVWQIIYRQYIDGTFNGQDWQAVRKEYLIRSYKSKQEAYTAIREMLEKLDDPFTRFMNPEEFKALQTNPDTPSIGLSVKTDKKTKELVVISPIEDSPAYKAGILSGDVLVKIDGKTTQGMNPTNVVSQLRGEASTPVTLTVRRGQKQLEFKIIREKIQLRPVSYKVTKTSKGNIGYIRLKQFSANASGEMREAIRDLERKQVAGYILDLRSNSGGLLPSIIEIGRMWLNKGTIFSTVNRKGIVEKETANGRALTNKPLIVIINDATASGAEILTAALQENNRGIVIGTKTIGYNTIQSVRPLYDGSGVAVTIAKWRTPKGRDISNLGISPDVVVNLTSSEQLAMIKNRSFGTMADPQFSKAVEKLIQLIKKK